MTQAIETLKSAAFLRLCSEESTRILPLKTAHLASKCSSIHSDGETLQFSLREGEFGYLVEPESGLNFSQSPLSLPIQIEHARKLFILVEPNGSKLENGCILFVLIYRLGRLFQRIAIPLHSGRIRRQFDMPRSGGRAALALKLVGTGALEPLDVLYSLVPISGLRHGAMALNPETKARSDAIRERYDQPFILDGVIFQSTAAQRPQWVFGLFSPSKEAMSRVYRPLRPDQAFPSEHQAQTCGFIFDSSLTESFFGWEGCLTPRNNIANMNLAKLLALSSARKIPTILLFDQACRGKPFFSDLAPYFDFQIEKPAEDIDDRIMALCGIEAA